MNVPVVVAPSTFQTGYQKTNRFKEQIGRVKIGICNGLATSHRVKLAAMLVLGALLTVGIAPRPASNYADTYQLLLAQSCFVTINR